MDNRLAARVKAVNKANFLAIEIHTALVKALLPYVDCQVIRGDGQLMVKVKKALPKFEKDSEVSILWESKDKNSLTWKVTVQKNVPDSTLSISYMVEVKVGPLLWGMLCFLVPPKFLRTDYSVQEVEVGRETLKHAKKLVDEAENKLGVFAYPDC